MRRFTSVLAGVGLAIRSCALALRSAKGGGAMCVRRSLLALSLAALTMPATAGATHSRSANPPHDFAVGGGAFAVPGDPEASFRFSVGATSGPPGGDPRGHLRIKAFDIVDPDPAEAEAFTVNGRVECLLVTGRTATIGALKRRFTSGGVEFVNYVVLSVFDAKRADMATVIAVTAPAPYPANQACLDGAPTSPPTGFFPLLRGNVVVHDAP
jgi:hypothetical protein